jgi:hypothetical protein
MAKLMYAREMLRMSQTALDLPTRLLAFILRSHHQKMKVTIVHSLNLPMPKKIEVEIVPKVTHSGLRPGQRL